VYKQCMGKADRAACRCTDAQKFSPLAVHSDCKERALRVYFADGYTPQFNVIMDGYPNARYMDKFTLVELNGRRDYCYNATNAPPCTNRTAMDAFPLSASLHDSLIFDGAELYHFRMTAHTVTHCELSTEFQIFVFEPGVQETVVWTIVSLTAVSLAMLLWGCYFLYYKSHGKRFS